MSSGAAQQNQQDGIKEPHDAPSDAGGMNDGDDVMGLYSDDAESDNDVTEDMFTTENSGALSLVYLPDDRVQPFIGIGKPFFCSPTHYQSKNSRCVSGMYFQTIL